MHLRNDPNKEIFVRTLIFYVNFFRYRTQDQRNCLKDFTNSLIFENEGLLKLLKDKFQISKKRQK